MLKRILGVFSIISLMVSLAACSPKAAADHGQEKIQLKIAGFYDGDYNADEDPVVLWLEQQTGYDLQVINAPGTAGSDHVKMIERIQKEEDQPDIFLKLSLSRDQISRLGGGGAFLDLSVYYNDRDGASNTFWTRLEEHFTAHQIKNITGILTEPETSAIYSVPTVDLTIEGPMDYQAWINTQLLQILNLEKPTTTEQLYAVLKAFKAYDPDCIPLYGTLNSQYGADLANWLICSYMYYNDQIPFNVAQDGRLYPAFTENTYRKALQFIRKLQDEKLLVLQEGEHGLNISEGLNTGQVYGIFVGTVTTDIKDKTQIIPYDILPPLQGQACVYNNSVLCNSFINAKSTQPEAAFRLLMTMWSEEASYWLRYGQYGVNWTDADPGSTSVCGYPLKIKVLNDLAMEISSARAVRWCVSSLFYEDGTYVQYNTYSESEAHYYQMIAQSRAAYDAAALENTPAQVCPVLRHTEDSLELRSAIEVYFKTATDEFILGVRDPHRDADWNKYLSDLENLGLAEYTRLAQAAYDRF